MAYDSATGDNWSAGAAGFQVSYQSTDGQGVKSYDLLSNNDGYGPQTLRVSLKKMPEAKKAPTPAVAPKPAPPPPKNFFSR